MVVKSIVTLALLVSATSAASISTISGVTDSDGPWIPADFESASFTMGLTFDASFEKLLVSFENGPFSNTWQMDWGGMDEPNFKYYNDGGIEASLTLGGVGDFTALELNEENFDNVVSSAKLVYYPLQYNPDGNFTSAVLASGPTGPLTPVVPEPGSLLLFTLGLLSLLLFWRNE